MSPLVQALYESLIDARTEESSASGIFFGINPNAAARSFKSRWLYSDPSMYALEPTAVSGSLTFIFHKNLFVTNMSLVELVSLIECNTTVRGGKPDAQPRNIPFFSDDQYTRFVANLLQSLYPGSPVSSVTDFEARAQKLAELIGKNYGDIFSNTMILSVYQTSVVLHVPKSLSLNLWKVVSESGYIQFGGFSLYVRNAEKAEQDELEERIQAFLEASKAERVFLTPYADEYFGKYEDEVIASIRNGLDGIRIQMRKHYISGQPLRRYLNALQARFKKLYVAPGSRHFQYEKDNSETTGEHSIWIVADRAAPFVDDEEIATQATKSYLVAYAQLFKNENQLTLFKERKPAWTAPITLPHTLSASMVNICRPYIQRSRERAPVFLDPFCGTGTTLIDAALRLPEAIVIGIDREPLMPRLVSDNLGFFALPANEIVALQHLMEFLARDLEQHQNSTGSPRTPPLGQIQKRLRAFSHDLLATSRLNEETRFEYAFSACLLEIVGGTANGHERADLEAGARRILDGNGFSDALCKVLSDSKTELTMRVLFYVTWRAIANGLYEVAPEPGRLYSVLAKEYKKVADELKEYVETLNRDRIAMGEKSDSFACIQGRYSKSGFIDPRKFADLNDGLLTHRSFSGQKSSELLTSLKDRSLKPGLYVALADDSVRLMNDMPRMVDFIITDPPYGFNTLQATTIEQFPDLYGEFVSAAVRALAPGGQLVLALPKFSRMGREIPYFQTRGAIVRQIIAAAESNGRRLVNRVQTYPGFNELYRKPYYWISTTALSRSILWFTIE